MSLAKGRWYRNGNGFSTGHYLLGKRYPMIDIDRMKLNAELSISRDNDVFVEYQFDFNGVQFLALFSMKHRQAQLTVKGGKAALDFVGNISNKVLREMARKLEARLFVVFHEDKEEPPFEILEVDLNNGSTVRKAWIHGQTKEAWQTAWIELGLKKDGDW